MKKYHPIKELFLGRMRTFYREPEAIFWTYGFPLILTILLGIAFRNRPQEVIDVDIADGPWAAEIQSQLEVAGGFVAKIRSAASCTERLRLGKTAIVVRRGEGLEYEYDPTRPDSALARARLDDVLQRALGRRDAVASTDHEITEPGARYIDFLVPGLLGMNLMGGGLWGIGFVVTDMRVRNLLRRLVATPMRRPHFLLALIGGRLVFTVPELLFILGAGVFLFDVRVSGGWMAIVVIAFIGSVSFAGLGLLIASRAKRIETISGLMNLVMLPMWLFSGIFFSSEKFPDAFQPFIQALPLTQLNDALRSIILEGGTLGDQLTRVAILVGWGGVSFLLALRWFRWT